MNVLKIIMLSFIGVLVVFACNMGTDAEQHSTASPDVKAGEVVSSNPGSTNESTKEEGRTAGITVKTDTESINKGKNLFDSKCSFCHDAFSAKTIVGPGLKGILKNPELPVSKKPATPENTANQIKNPYKDMPSFSYLPEEDVLNIIAYLNTL